MTKDNQSRLTAGSHEPISESCQGLVKTDYRRVLVSSDLSRALKDKPAFMFDGSATSAFPPIVLQKSFWSDERNYLEPLMRLTRGDVGDHIDSSKIDHGLS